MMTSRRLDRLSWYFGVPGTLLQFLGFELVHRSSSAGYPVLITGTALVAIGIALVCRGRNVNPLWSIVAVVPVVGFWFCEFWLFDRLAENDNDAA